eukprot:3745493-Amphidinium_carterae.1
MSHMCHPCGLPQLRRDQSVNKSALPAVELPAYESAGVRHSRPAQGSDTADSEQSIAMQSESWPSDGQPPALI